MKPELNPVLFHILMYIISETQYPNNVIHVGHVVDILLQAPYYKAMEESLVSLGSVKGLD